MYQKHLKTGEMDLQAESYTQDDTGQQQKMGVLSDPALCTPYVSGSHLCQQNGSPAGVCGRISASGGSAV